MNKNIPSLELCERLKDLGRSQTPTEYIWDYNKSKQVTIVKYIDELNYTDRFAEDTLIAPTIAEMLEVLPKAILARNGYFVGNEYLSIVVGDNGSDWAVIYGHDDYTPFVSFEDTSLAEALASMLIWLIENKYLDLKGK